ncbi:response regulator [candidate division KSB1 bacterium]|nr:response regulator [candidate division KSB1 bacterium]
MPTPVLDSPPVILLIDGNERHARFYQTQLEAQGFSVIYTQQGQQALEQLNQKKFDIALVDTQLADIDGLDLISTIALSYRSTAIIIHTATPFFGNNFRSWAADAVVVKSKSAGELLEKMVQLLQKRSTSPGHSSRKPKTIHR